jgi:hypothetical protein
MPLTSKLFAVLTFYDVGVSFIDGGACDRTGLRIC